MRTLVAGAIAALLLLPSVSAALTIDELKAQVALLLAQMAALSAEVGTIQSTTITSETSLDSSPPAAAACPALVRTLSRGKEGGDVLALQQFLAAAGHLSAESATGYFGPLTEAAVKEWQSENGIVSSGTPATTGWGLVGARTRAAMRAACGGVALPSNDTLSLSSRGLALSADATVNARGSCSALSYNLDFGDGSPSVVISVDGGSCQPMQQTVLHTYAAPGSYSVALASSRGTITVPIKIQGVGDASACALPDFESGIISNGVLGKNWNLPVVRVAQGSDAPTVTASGLPPGILLRSSTQLSSDAGTMWVLDGIPTKPGSYTFAITVENSCGKATRSITMTVVEA